MRRIIAFILSALLCLSLCACGGGDKDTEKGKTPSTGSDLTWDEIMKEAERQLAEEGRNAG